MRMWMINPKVLCNQHLLGEHNEHHMFAGCIQKDKSIKGYIKTGLVEVHNLKKRHNELILEMQNRGMNHKSPFPEIKLFRAGKIDIYKNIADLMHRCPECRKNIENHLGIRNIKGDNMPAFSENKRIKIMNSIFDTLEDRSSLLSEWEAGFLEDMQKKLAHGFDLTQKQFDKLTDIIGFDYLK